MARAEALIRPVRAGDAEALAANLRAEDCAEVIASTGLQPLEVVRGSLETSARTFAAELGGELAALGGVVEGARRSFLGPPDLSVAWLLTTGAVARHPRAFWAASRTVLEALLREYPTLCNSIDARYAAALRWARRLGAEVRPAIPWGASGELFHPVIWRRTAWATH